MVEKKSCSMVQAIPLRLLMLGGCAVAVLHNMMTPSLQGYIRSSLDCPTTAVSQTAGLDHASSRVAAPFKPYRSAPMEDYILKHTKQLGYQATSPNSSFCCTIWNDKKASTVYDDLHKYVRELGHYYERVRNFTSPFTDLRKALVSSVADPDGTSVCDSLELHPNGLVGGIFQSQQLSETTRMGFVEPLLPSLRHIGFCSNKAKFFMNLDYLVHDFAAMCRRMSSTSRTVFVDMGASLDFHGDKASPAMTLIKLYAQFGMPFDHIYAYEVTPTEPDKVFRLLPDEMQAAYHWINVPVDPDPDGSRNPLRMLLENYGPEDLIVVKLDIDTPSVEMPMVEQLLNNPRLHVLVDQFYFEHHVHMAEMERSWGKKVNGSVHDSLTLFHALREKGVAAHHWV
jgi:hypothetical protein